MTQVPVQLTVEFPELPEFDDLKERFGLMADDLAAQKARVADVATTLSQFDIDCAELANDLTTLIGDVDRQIQAHRTLVQDVQQLATYTREIAARLAALEGATPPVEPPPPPPDPEPPVEPPAPPAGLVEHPSRVGRDLSTLAGWRHDQIDFANGWDAPQIAFVDTLAPDGPGSLKAALETPDNGSWLVIVPRVGGTIQNTSGMAMNRPRTWLAGELAPGKGLEVTENEIWIRPREAVVGHMRFRPGYNPNASGTDGLNIREVDGGQAFKGLVYNCSVQGGNDEILAVDAQQDGAFNRIRNVSFVDCLFGYPIDNPASDEEPHIFGPYILDGAHGIEFARCLIGGFRMRCIGIELGASGTMFSNIVVAPSEGGTVSAPMCVLEGTTKQISYQGAIDGVYDARQDSAGNLVIGWRGEDFASRTNHNGRHPRHPEMIAGRSKIYDWRDANYLADTWGGTARLERQVDPKGEIASWVNLDAPSYAPNHAGWRIADIRREMLKHVGAFPANRDEMDAMNIADIVARRLPLLKDLPAYSFPQSTTLAPFNLSNPFGFDGGKPRIAHYIHDRHRALGGLPWW